MQILFSKNRINSKSVLKDFSNSHNDLLDLKTEEIVNTFDRISSYWLSPECKVKDLFQKEGLGFLIPWLRKGNIKNLLNLNFQNLAALDEPYLDNDSNSYLYGRPLGIAIHWIAGNVPVLGVISLFQTILTRNKSIVKVPSSFKNVLPDLLKDLNETDFFKGKEKEILDAILSQILLVFVTKEDVGSQRKLSILGDIRVCWGGVEAVNNIIGLPKKINCRDLIFGPKISLAIATKEKLKKQKDLEELGKLLSDDVFAFNQVGCNAPHNLLIEKGSGNKLEAISHMVRAAFEKKSESVISETSPIDSFNILSKKFVYQSAVDKDVISGKGNSWNIFINKRNNSKLLLEDPIFSRSIFITEFQKLEDLSMQFPANVQSVGLFSSENRKKKIIQLLSDHNVDRFPDLGRMSLYRHPWDGYLPLQLMVKWISTN